MYHFERIDDLWTSMEFYRIMQNSVLQYPEMQFKIFSCKVPGKKFLFVHSYDTSTHPNSICDSNAVFITGKN